MRDTAAPLTTPLYWIAFGLLAASSPPRRGRPRRLPRSRPSRPRQRRWRRGGRAGDDSHRRRWPRRRSRSAMAGHALADAGADDVAALRGGRAWIRGVVVELRAASDGIRLRSR
jgi:hypothetical protein